MAGVPAIFSPAATTRGGPGGAAQGDGTSMAVADVSSTSASALALASAIVVLITAVVNGLVALRTARQGKETRNAVISSSNANDEALSGLATSIVALSRSIDERFSASQVQMTTLVDVLRDLINRVFPPQSGNPS